MRIEPHTAAGLLELAFLTRTRRRTRELCAAESNDEAFLYAVAAACSLQPLGLAAPAAAAGPHENIQGHGRGGQRAGSAAERRLTSNSSPSAARAAGGRFIFGYVKRAAQTFRAASRRRGRWSAPRAAAALNVSWLPVSFLPTPTVARVAVRLPGRRNH